MGFADTLRFATLLGIREDTFLSRLQSQESEAVTLVIREYTPALYRAALGYGLAEDHADEIVQATWEVFFLSLVRFEGRSKIKTFLIGILLNKLREYRRSRSRSEATDDIEKVSDANFDAEGNWNYRPIPPDQFAEAAETRKYLAECLSGISETHRMVVLLREWERQTSSEICQTLSISETNLGVMVHRAKNKLRTCLEKKSVAHGA